MLSETPSARPPLSPLPRAPVPFLASPSLWNSRLCLPGEVPAQGPHWGGSSSPQREGVFPPISLLPAGARCPRPLSLSPGVSPGPCARAGLGSQGWRWAGLSPRTHSRALAPSFSGVKPFPRGPSPSPASRWDDRVEIRLASVGLDFKSFPQCFIGMACLF